MNHDTTPPAGRSLPWMLISVVLHLMLLGVLGLIVAAPPEPIDSQHEDRLRQVRGEKLEQAGEKLRQINRRELEQNLDRLEQIEAQMRELRQAQAEQLAREMADRPEAARQRALALAEQIIAAQQAVIETQAEIGPRLHEAGAAMIDQVESPQDRERIERFAPQGAGRDSAERLSQVGREIDAAAKTIDHIQQLQVQLAEEIAWMGRPDTADKQAAALEAQEHAKRQVSRTRDQLAWLRRDLDTLRDRVATYQRVIDTDAMRDHVRRYAHGSIGNLLKHPAELDARHAAAQPAHESALQAQQAALQALVHAPPPPPLKPEDFLADYTPPEAEDTNQPDRGSDETETSTETSSDTTPMPGTGDETPTVADLYEQMLATEQALSRMHRDVRANALVQQGAASPQTARRQLQADAPIRPALDRQVLDGSTASGSAYLRYQEQLETALATSRAILTSAQATLDAARTAALPDPRETTHASDTQDGEISFAGNVAGGGPDPGDGRPSAFDPEAWRQRTMAQVRSARYLPADHPPDQPWTFINGWYMIGPFTTGSSADLHRRYTPEAVVDLDATYSGPDGRRLSWAFRKEADPGTSYFPVQRGNSVYYAFTHLKAERDMTVRLALASDDASQLWVNDQPVEPPGWHETECGQPWLFSFGNDVAQFACALHYRGYRDATLRAGVNTLLIRVENGPGGTGFALYAKPLAPQP